MGTVRGHPVESGDEVAIEKAWSPSASSFDSERSRGKRAKAYEERLVGAGPVVPAPAPRDEGSARRPGTAEKKAKGGEATLRQA